MKIRLDFVTNSSSTSFMIIVEKLADDATILKEIEAAMGYGPKGAKDVLDLFSEPDEYELQQAGIDSANDRLFSAVILTSDTECTLSIASTLANNLFNNPKLLNKVPSLKVRYQGEEN